MPYRRGRIPYTEGRLAQSLIIRAYNIKDNYNSEKNPSDYSAGKIIGACTEFNRIEKRTTIKRKSIGKKGMRPFHVIPQSTDIELSLKRVSLYKKEFLSEIGGISGSLLHQDRPLILQESQTTPTGKVENYQYHDCWFETNPINYNIMGDLLIIQDIKVSAAYMKPIGAAFGGWSWIINQSVNVLKDYSL